VRHPVDGKLMTFVESGPFAPPRGQPVWLPGYYIDVLPITGGDYSQFVTITGHRPPSGWPDGNFTESMTDTPVQVPWVDATAYAAWASKGLPTPVQWDRAAFGDEGMVASHLLEWCTSARGPRRHEPPSGSAAAGQPGFRCIVPAEEMLALLAI
jgi:hypothetical protein